MAGESRWRFTQVQLSNTPSQRCGIDNGKELNYRQQLANIIQDMGQRLQVTQLCINTAIVYMHRFYMFHSFAAFNRNSMASACLFLAAKVEEQPRKLEHVIKVAHLILNNKPAPLDTKSDAYLKQAQELVINENILLQTLGFDITVDHPHTHVVKTSQLVKASKDLAQTSYFLATNSLHLTTMCLQYRPTVVAAVCIHLACKWSNWSIPRSSEGKEWYQYIDSKVSPEVLEDLSAEFLNILERCPSKLRKKIMAWKMTLQSGRSTDHLDSSTHAGRQPSATVSSAAAAASGSSSQSGYVKPEVKQEPGSSQKPHPNMPQLHAPRPEPKTAQMGEAGLRRVKTEPSLTSLTPQEYRERKERERAAERERAERAARQQQEQMSRSGHPRSHGSSQHPHADPNKHHHHRHHGERSLDPHHMQKVQAAKDMASKNVLPSREHARTQHTRPDVAATHAHTDKSKSRDQHRTFDHRTHADPASRHTGESSREKVRPTERPAQEPLLAKLSQDLSVPTVSIDPLPPPEMLMAELTKTVGSEPDKPALEARLPPRQTQAIMAKSASNVDTVDVVSVAPEPPPPPPPSESRRQKPPAESSPPPPPPPPPPGPPAEVKQEPPSTGGETKLKLSLGQLSKRYEAANKHDKPSPRKNKRDRSRDSEAGSDKREHKRERSRDRDQEAGGDKKDLKLKISLGSAPAVSSVKREEASTRSSPSSGELKLKLDLKGRRSEPTERRPEPAASERRSPLKLKLKIGPSSSTSSGSPQASSSHRSKHSSSHSSKSNGSHSAARKRPYSPQTAPQPAKMSRNDSLSDMTMANALANGSGTASPNIRTPTTENIEDVRRQLQQLIDLQSAQLHAKSEKTPPTQAPL